MRVNVCLWYRLLIIVQISQLVGCHVIRREDKGQVSCKGQPSPNQQLSGVVLNAICEKLGNANFLVFGTGYDSPFWLDSNPHGATHFLEHHKEWIGFQPARVKDLTLPVHYTSKFSEAKDHINDAKMLSEFYETQVPEDLKRTHWDQILVDSPEGYGSSNPGRGQSIYAAKLMAQDSTVIFVDDCERSAEMLYIKKWLLQDETTGKRRQLTQYSNGHGGSTCRIGAAA
eukprot:TRINITY_DN8586_c0_g2_i1.p1 TRINITY_DN8586_c0_g2~~TRINITY_DN8586_c0_g2_i1.p1  ORF type:complete len:228 (-),score=37.55 TRINITY_DN8586_c0_g2_i1:37-720(-)